MRTTDGRTDMTKLIAAFRNFAKAPENRVKSEGSRSKWEKEWRNSFETSENYCETSRRHSPEDSNLYLSFPLLRFSGYHSSSAIGRLKFKILAPNRISDCAFHGFPESLHEYVWTVLQIMSRLLPSTLQSSVIDPPFDAVYSKLPTASLSQRQRKKYINIFHVFHFCDTY